MDFDPKYDGNFRVQPDGEAGERGGILNDESLRDQRRLELWLGIAFLAMAALVPALVGDAVQFMRVIALATFGSMGCAFLWFATSQSRAMAYAALRRALD